MNILNDSGLTNINSIFNLKSKLSKNTIESLINKQSSFPSLKTVLENQKTIENLRNLNDTSKNEIETVLNNIIEKEKDLQFFFDEENALENLEKDTFGQLLFQHPQLKIFNTFPFLVFFLSYVKIYFVPIISVTLPFLMYFLPYLIIKYVWRLPMNYETYQGIMGQMISFSFDGSFEKLAQNIFTIFTFAQSMYQPIQNALHLNKIDNTIYSLGKDLYEYTNHVKNLINILKKYDITFRINNSLESFCDEFDYRKNFSLILDNPNYLYLVCYDISKFEILFSLSKNKRFKK